MKIRVKQFREYLSRNNLATEKFASKINVALEKVEKLLNGEAVGINTARKFIHELGAGTAQSLIDWDAIGKKNPLEDFGDRDQNREN